MSCAKSWITYAAAPPFNKPKNINQGIQEAIKSLAAFPERHQKMELIGTDQRVYHSFPKWSFLIIYRVEEKVLRVRVVSIFNTNQNPEKLEDIDGR